MKRAYTKPWLSLQDQVARLEKAGLEVGDPAAAAKLLRHLNYYRFSGYGLAFETSRHVFAPGTTFEQILAAYVFDRTLRDLVYESMEVIELDVRTSVAYQFGQTYGAFGHLDPANFFYRLDHAKWVREIREQTERSSEVFVEHFKTNYQEFPDLPIWAATEIMSFGTLSWMIQGMLKPDQKSIATRFGLQPDVLSSGIHHLVYVRNLCAHHARLWDREFAIKTVLPAGNNWKPPILPRKDKLFASLLIQAVFLKGCAAERDFVHDWRSRVESHIQNHAPECPNPLNQMGLTADWTQHPVWDRI